MVTSSKQGLEQHWRQVLTNTFETDFFDVLSRVTSAGAQGSIVADSKAEISIQDCSAIISGTQASDGVSAQYPISYLVKSDLYVGTDDGMFLLLEKAGLASTPIAPLLWAKEAKSFRHISSNRAIALVVRSQLARGGSFELSGDLSASESSDYVEVHLTENSGLISEVVVDIEVDGLTTRTELGISPRSKEVQVARPPAHKVIE
ncbi:hypothetical protein [Corynebacterium sp.]|uniref:hypothetical protein n=1 Tax=Corynebacterium sp. TaxID=1720 RepID=UPI002649BF2B|nr:hypothetical protein [Corynebacterium sp.]MDN6136029.1 hypothetical protein [Corynebacterium sp.]